MTSRELRAMVRKAQADSESIASDDLEESAALRALHETSTVAVRLIRSDVDAISSLAAERGVPVSALLRTWILAGLRNEQGEGIDATLIQLEQGISRLRQALG